MPRRSRARREEGLQRLQARVDKMAGGPCIAAHDLAEQATDYRPILLMASPPGRCGRCDAIRERQREWDLAHPHPQGMPPCGMGISQ